MGKHKGYSIQQRGDSYTICVNLGRNADGKQIRKTATYKPDPKLTPRQKEKALEKYAYEFEQRVRNGLVYDGEKMTFSDFCKKWESEYAAYNLAETTRESYHNILEKTILPELGHHKIAKIKPLTLVSFYNDLKNKGYERNGVHREYSRSSLQRYHAIISSIMSTAVQWQIIDSNPCQKCKPPKDNDRITEAADVKYFTLEEAERFLEALTMEYETTYTAHDRVDDTGKTYHVDTYIEKRGIPLQLQVFFNVALYGGLRRGENIALTWDDIDWEHNTVSVNKSAAIVDKKQIVKVPKNKSSIRVVTLPVTVMELLKKHRVEQLQYRLSIGDQWQTDDNGNPNNYIYTQWNGSQMYLSTPYHAFKDIIRKYNQTVENPSLRLPNIPLHGLRHTSATLLISRNVDVRTVSGRLGHAQTSTTMNIYAHSLQEMDVHAADTLEDLFHNKKSV